MWNIVIVKIEQMEKRIIKLEKWGKKWNKIQKKNKIK